MSYGERIRKGMVVMAADGHRLGKVVSSGQTSLIIEKGLFFPVEYVADFSQVGEIRGDEVWLIEGRAALEGERDRRDTLGAAGRADRLESELHHAR